MKSLSGMGPGKRHISRLQVLDKYMRNVAIGRENGKNIYVRHFIRV